MDTWFEREWPELEKKLGAISPVAAAAPPQRPEREMVAELLELSRAAAANVDWSKEALVTLLRGMNRLIGQAGLAAREPSMPRSALGDAARSRVADDLGFWGRFVESAMREPAGGSEAGRKILEVLAAGPEGASPEEEGGACAPDP